MIELTEEAYDGEAMTVLAAALQAEVNERYDDGTSNEEDDANFLAEVTPELVARPRGVCVVARVDDVAVGCGALKPYADQPGTAEVKRMYTTPGARRSGVARAVLAHLEAAAVELGYRRLLLETGTAQPEALALYESAGWHRVTPFGFYKHSEQSVCFGKAVASG